MVAPTLASDHPGLEILAEIAKVLAAGRPADEGLPGVVGVLRRGLALRRCRLWLRSADGSRFLPIVSPEEETQLPGFTSAVADWVAQGPHRESVAGGTLLRLPLMHENQALGCFEVIIPQDPHERVAHDVLVVAAQMLAPVLAAHELSQDLASEVALRTREHEAQRNFAARIIDSLPVGLYVIDRGYRIRAWNRKREAGTQGVSREDALGREVFEVLDRQPRELLKLEFDRVFATGEIQTVEMDSQTTGEARHYRITKIPMRMDGEDISHVITIGEDVTAWRQAQQRLAQSEKLAAVGQLAAGVMHEINNPLATILACSEALSLRVADMPEQERQGQEEYLRIVDTEVQRCRRIVEGLLDFSRPNKQSGHKAPADINAIIDQTLFLLKHHERFKWLTIERQLESGLPQFPADAERLVQCFMALMLNAMDAMNARGVLTVRTHGNPQRSDEIMAEFIDTGTGIRQEDLPKIFEPFSPPSPGGGGRGLGRSFAYGIAGEHRGRMEVESKRVLGTNFKVSLPVG